MPDYILIASKIEAYLLGFCSVAFLIFMQNAISGSKKMITFLETGKGLSEEEMKKWENLPKKDKAELTPEFFRKKLHNKIRFRNIGIVLLFSLTLLFWFISKYSMPGI